MTSTVGDKTNFTLTWEQCTTNRAYTANYDPKYTTLVKSTDSEGVLAFHMPERAFLKEFRIQPVGENWGSNFSFVTIVLNVGTDKIVKHKILEADTSTRDDPKIFDLSGPSFLAPATARVWVSVASNTNLNNANDSNQYQCSLWGQWIR